MSGRALALGTLLGLIAFGLLTSFYGLLDASIEQLRAERAYRSCLEVEEGYVARLRACEPLRPAPVEWSWISWPPLRSGTG